MRKRITIRTLAGMTLWAGLAGGQAAAQVKTEDVLARKPIQPGVAVTTPTAAELAAYRAEQVTWPKGADGKAPTGVVVKDAQGRLVRQFIDTTGGDRPNIFSYYLNGVESYREVDGNGNGKVDQFRWLGPNGGKWGADADENGQVDTWYVLSPEELSQELFDAMRTKDAKRVEALLPNDQDLKSLGLPESEVAKIKQKAAGAVKRMQETADALKLTDQSKWVHLELGLPHVTPGDSFGGRDDLVRQRSAVVLVDKGDGKTADVFQTGELILVGRVWRLVEGPAYGAAPPTLPGSPDAPAITVVEAIRADVDELAKIKPDGTDAAAMAKYQAARAVILERIVGKTQGADQEPWLRQVIDAYATAAEGGPADGPALQRLKQWVAKIEQDAPKTPAAAYAAYRLLSAEYLVKAPQIKTEDDYTKLSAWWREQLQVFITKNPRAEETPDAMSRLAQAFEAARDGELGAKGWYERLAKDFPGHPLAAKAQGALRRLNSEGQPFALDGQTLDGKAFSAAQLAGKPAVVYYWASWGQQTAAELKQLAELAKAHDGKLVIVTVNVDDDPAKAVQALNAAQVPGHHLHAPGGLDRSPLAAAYGIQMVPHLFLVGKDGKVVNRNAHAGPMLKDEVEKLVK
jgi:thiol-disulfide isomerase/thioredoxin